MHYGELDKLQYLGRSGAHISHELKNILATISETAGLMGDLLAMSAPNQCDPNKLASLCERITGLVERGNETVRNLNGLAHSVDEPVRETEVNHHAEVAAGLASYAPFARPIEISLKSPEGINLPLRPFETLNLITETLRAGCSTIESGQSLSLEVSENNGGAQLLLEGVGSVEAENECLARALGLCAALGSATLNVSPGRWIVRLEPEK